MVKGWYSSLGLEVVGNHYTASGPKGQGREVVSRTGRGSLYEQGSPTGAACADPHKRDQRANFPQPYNLFLAGPPSQTQMEVKGQESLSDVICLGQPLRALNRLKSGGSTCIST